MFSRRRDRPRRGEGVSVGPEAMLGLAEHTPDLVAVATREALVYANTAARRFLTGRADAQVLGRALFSAVHPDDREAARKLAAEVIASGRALDWTEVRLVSDDGRELDLWVSVAPIVFRGEASLLVLGRDDSAARAALRAREESERRYRTLADNAPVAIQRLDAEGRCIYVNEAWCALTGIPREEALGTPWPELLAPQEHAAAVALARKMTGSGQPERGDYRIPLRNGRELSVIGQAVPERDGSGARVGWLTTFTDTADLKAAQRALTESEERLRLSLEAANVASWETDNSPSEVMRWSANAAQVLGLAEHAVPRTRSAFWALLPAAQTESLRVRTREAATAGEPFEFEFRLGDERGGERWLVLRGRALPAVDGIGPARMAGVVSDVTARKRLTEEREALLAKLQEAQRLESLGLLAAGVAHDFNNLLVGILGNAELALADTTPGAPLRERIEELRAASLRAAELAQQILAYSGRGPLLSAPVELEPLARETLARLGVWLPANARVRIDARPGALALGDATQLRQVLMNLVRNAVEALGAAGGDVVVEVAPEPGAEHVRLSVIDTGRGMDGPTRARIFDPFFTTRATGRGLGLAVVHGIVRAHGGDIAVRSEPGHGTRMDVRLPAARVFETAPDASRREEPPPRARGELVLVVDDERAVRDVSRLALEAAGYTVECAETADEVEGVVRRERGRLSAVVLDLSLGPRSSEPVVVAIRALAPEVPILVTSGYPDGEAMEQLASHGISGFLSKPFTPSQLARSVAEVRARGSGAAAR